MGQVSPYQLSRTTILVADDDPDVRDMLRTFLELEAYHVLEAADGRQAWEMIQALRPDLVIVDMNMPGYNGIRLAGLVKERELTTKLIAFTAGMATEAECMAAGYDGYFLKTDSLRRLGDTIRRVLGP